MPIENATDSPAAAPPAPPRLLDWLKLLFPVVVLAFYAASRVFSGAAAGSVAAAEHAPEAASLAGLPDGAVNFRLPTGLRIFVKKLDEMRARDRWEDVLAEVAKTSLATREHPIVRGYWLLARAKTGERGAMIERDIIATAPLISRDGDYWALREQLDVTHATLVIDRIRTPDLYLANADLLHRLLDDLPLRPSVIEARIAAARRVEAVAAARFEEARSIAGDDKAAIREARGLHQEALRWLTVPEGWRTLSPVSDAARPHIERILGRIQEANRALNPTSLPFTDRDASTWTGKRGDPIHDEPGAR